MARYASLLSVDLSQMYPWSKFEDPISCCYVETELNAIIRETWVVARYAALLSIDLPQMYL